MLRLEASVPFPAPTLFPAGPLNGTIYRAVDSAAAETRDGKQGRVGERNSSLVIGLSFGVDLYRVTYLGVTCVGTGANKRVCTEPV